MNQSSKFKKIKESLAKLQKKQKEKKSINVWEILNDEERDENLKEKEEAVSLNKKEKNKKYLERADINEAIFIATDLHSLMNKKKK